MGNQRATGVKRLMNATKYSWLGFKTAYKSEEAFRQETWTAIILIPAGLWLGETGMEKALLVGSVVLVLIVELLNTGIEFVVDRFGDEIHKYSGAAKDVGSAAVFFALVNVVVVWILVLIF